MEFNQILRENIYIYVFYFIYTVLITFCSIYISKKFKIIDYPSEIRKIHKFPTPLIGFFYFLLTFFFVLIGNFFTNDFTKSFLISVSFGVFLATVIGFIDDKTSLSANSRIILFIIILLLSISLNEELVIKSVRSLIFNQEINLNLNFAYIFTVLCYLLLINSLNLSDGINGIAIMISITWLTSISIFSPPILQKLNFFLVINLFVVLIFNLRTKIFLGSAGINFISTYICFVTVYTFNNSEILQYEYIFLFFMIPGLDMMRVFFLRIWQGQNPFTPDKNHFHHLLINKFSLTHTLLIYFSLMLIPIFIFLKFTQLVIYLIIIEFFIYSFLIRKLSVK